ncbi:MAG TPA: S46 family peptidase, partial [Thermoanaerobaculia bacterium]|nr:S46 family peptidase [Thermoanaerobaculia bacterium]
WAAGRSDQAEAVAAQKELARMVEGELRTWNHDFLLDQTKSGPKPLELALTLVRWAGEKVKPDLEREPDSMERERERLRERLRRDQKRMHLPTEEALLADLLLRSASLPEGSRVAAMDELLGSVRTPDAVRAKAADLIAHTKVSDAAERDRMFDESTEELQSRHDPLLDLAFALDRELRERKVREDRTKGTIARLRPEWQKAVIAHAGRPVAPDANGTLRVSLARVQGYVPRDAVRLEPQTTVGGLVQKDTGEEPFAAPKAVLEAAPGAPASRWADPKLKDVPVAFLADADTTGGSSGSPVLNSRGELVGVNFDRVWENVAGDFGYNPEVARNVSADVRYLLWLLETLHGEGAQGVLKEMGGR